MQPVFWYVPRCRLSEPVLWNVVAQGVPRAPGDIISRIIQQMPTGVAAASLGPNMRSCGVFRGTVIVILWGLHMCCVRGLCQLPRVGGIAEACGAGGTHWGRRASRSRGPLREPAVRVRQPVAPVVAAAAAIPVVQQQPRQAGDRMPPPPPAVAPQGPLPPPPPGPPPRAATVVRGCSCFALHHDALSGLTHGTLREWGTRCPCLGSPFRNPRSSRDAFFNLLFTATEVQPVAIREKAPPGYGPPVRNPPTDIPAGAVAVEAGGKPRFKAPPAGGLVRLKRAFDLR